MRIKAALTGIAIALVLIISFGVYRRLQKPGEEIIVDKSSSFNGIDEIVKRELLKIGVSDSDVIRMVHEEKENNNIAWILLTKEVLVKEDVLFEEWESEIRSSLEYINAEVYKTIIDRKKDSITLEIGQDDLVMEVITLRHAPANSCKVAIILDDLGYNRQVVEEYLKLDIPITYAILPYTDHSKYLAKKIKKAGHDTLLHLPCEPKDYPRINPGPGAILVSMKPSQIRRTILSDLTTVPGVIGANNHQGSRLMEDKKLVKYALEVLKRRGLFFVDSVTTPNSKGLEVAKELEMKSAANNIFLDNEDKYDYVANQMERLRVHVKKYGRAVAIGHVTRKATLEVLTDYIPKFKEDGISFVHISELLE